MEMLLIPTTIISNFSAICIKKNFKDRKFSLEEFVSSKIFMCFTNHLTFLSFFNTEIFQWPKNKESGEQQRIKSIEKGKNEHFSIRDSTTYVR